MSSMARDIHAGRLSQPVFVVPPPPDHKWDYRFLALAETVAGWSKDPSTKVGAVIVRPDKTVASMGFNGFPRGVEDDEARYNDRPTKYMMVVHAELNAILTAREPLHGYTLYCTPLSPCSTCAASAIQAGIKRVVCQDQGSEGRWGESQDAAAVMFHEAGVEVVHLSARV